MNVPIRHHKIAHQLDALVEFLLRPAGYIAVQPTHQCWIRHDAVFALHFMVTTPLTELAYKRIRYFARQLLPVLFVAIGKYFGKLRDAKVRQVHQAGRIIDDKADRHTILWVEYRNVAGLLWPLAFFLTAGGHAVKSKLSARGCQRRYLQKIAPCHSFLYRHTLPSSVFGYSSFWSSSAFLYPDKQLSIFHFCSSCFKVLPEQWNVNTFLLK